MNEFVQSHHRSGVSDVSQLVIAIEVVVHRANGLSLLPARQQDSLLQQHTSSVPHRASCSAALPLATRGACNTHGPAPPKVTSRACPACNFGTKQPCELEMSKG